MRSSDKVFEASSGQERPSSKLRKSYQAFWSARGALASALTRFVLRPQHSQSQSSEGLNRMTAADIADELVS